MSDSLEELERQIDRLASYIMGNIEGEPSQSQGAVDTAIRIMGDQARAVEGLRAEVARLTKLAKDNNALARMYKAQADEFRQKYVAAMGEAG